MDNETNTQTDAAEIEAGASQNVEGQATEEKAFTQADVDDIIKKRLERERKNAPSKEELEQFRAWKSSQNENQDKQQTDSDNAAQATEEAETVKQLKQQISKMELDHALDYAIQQTGAKSAKLLKNVLDMDKIHCVNGTLTGFSEQLETIKQDYSYLFGDTVTGSWGQRQPGNIIKTDGVETAFLKRNPGLKLY
jgi:hypothetical protein